MSHIAEHIASNIPDTPVAPVPPPPVPRVSRRQRAKALVARLRHKQLLTALSGRVVESAIYARRALRVRRAFCTCA